MPAQHYWYFAAIVLVIVGWSARARADDNVTIYGEGAPASGSAPASTATTSSSSTAAHKSKHRHKKTSVAATGTSTSDSTTAKKKSTVSADGPAPQPAQFSPAAAEPPASTAPIVSTSSTHVDNLPPSALTPASTAPSATGPVTVSAPASTAHDPSQITISDPVAPPPALDPSDKPQVETGLPVARPGSKTYTLGSSFPLPPVIPVSATASSYGSQKGLLDNFSFTDLSRRPKNIYPWKTRIYTTKFWIGEGSTTISSTDNVESAWDENWRTSNNGTDTPDDRDGYAPAHHIAGINPFYVALPFNDLAFPDKARRWLPAGWYRPPGRDGKQVSACKDRWVEIKNAQGDVCYAQWEDVGPLRYDHAEYVFGDERPDTYTRAGLDVSPAVFDYLGLDDRRMNLTSWRFVDAADVQPGAWLKYDEEVLLLKAIRASNDKDILPIERARAPIVDPDDIDSSQKKLSKAKG